ncbi:unknown protein [Microcystis aeruginosa NIES-843]|uniref:Uncharacterized protein n=1 Tax=Microcystis aeruginosa (strain NIES-843 / IAM M-2473) TaxID=449447 RepID=B0JLK4_MICAN|nr:unknown protein [Microcystis aeruginosa NIES-843]
MSRQLSKVSSSRLAKSTLCLKSCKADQKSLTSLISTNTSSLSGKSTSSNNSIILPFLIPLTNIISTPSK